MSPLFVHPGREAAPHRPLIDPFGRTISYLRVSVTDRCDLRCAYCMPERMTFLPRKDLLSIEELARLSSAFIRRGVRKVRLTGGEPLVRKGVEILLRALGEEVAAGRLDELTLTTNATQLERYAAPIAAAGVRRINVSLDTLDPALFERLTRRPALADVLRGIDAAEAAGLSIKINIVALKGANEDEIPEIIAWAHGRGFDASLIEVMPLGDVDVDRMDHYLPLSEVRERLARLWTLEPIAFRTGGPSRYVQIAETGGRLGFIAPLTNNFCDGCNRVRLTCTGRLYMCLGQEDSADFHHLLRNQASDAAIDAAIESAIAYKPKGHDFRIDSRCAKPAVGRTMSATGG